MARFSFKLKPKINEFEKPSWLYWVFVGVIVIATLSVALLWPEQISALWFELWLGIISFLRQPYTFQFWFLALILLFTAWSGWLIMPIFEAPTNNDRIFYIWTWEEGDIRYFRTLTGYILQIYKEHIKRRGMRWVTTVPTIRTAQGRYIIYQSTKLEMTKILMWKKIAETKIEENKKLRAELARKEIHIPFEKMLDLEKARRGRGGEGER